MRREPGRNERACIERIMDDYRVGGLNFFLHTLSSRGRGHWQGEARKGLDWVAGGQWDCRQLGGKGRSIKRCTH